jgi:hypothetical protein
MTDYENLTPDELAQFEITARADLARFDAELRSKHIQLANATSDETQILTRETEFLEWCKKQEIKHLKNLHFYMCKWAGPWC